MKKSNLIVSIFLMGSLSALHAEMSVVPEFPSFFQNTKKAPAAKEKVAPSKEETPHRVAKKEVKPAPSVEAKQEGFKIITITAQNRAMINKKYQNYKKIKVVKKSYKAPESMIETYAKYLGADAVLIRKGSSGDYIYYFIKR